MLQRHRRGLIALAVAATGGFGLCTLALFAWDRLCDRHVEPFALAAGEIDGQWRCDAPDSLPSQLPAAFTLMADPGAESSMPSCAVEQHTCCASKLVALGEQRQPVVLCRVDAPSGWCFELHARPQLAGAEVPHVLPERLGILLERAQGGWFAASVLQQRDRLSLRMPGVDAPDAWRVYKKF